MRALILAAGQGSRLRPAADCKPLALVAGTPLLEHVVRRVVAGGADGITLVTGHQADRIHAFAASLSERLDVDVDCVRAPDWTRPNGHSLLAGAATIAGDYLLLMADHLFDPAVVRRLIAAGRGAAGLVLAVDRDLAGPLLDLDDATKVETGAGGRIVRIGKTLTRYDAIDTGLFLAGPALARAVGDAIAAGAAGSLSEGVQNLADRGQAMTLDVTGSPWIDVDDPRMLGLAEAFVAQG
jgi:choline kinase